ncbi:hypothetical protein [Paenibacillus darwinianus]|nr:hypothetical protein [Paenibacillus darwinianus]
MGRFVSQARQTQNSLDHVADAAGRTRGRIVSLRGAIVAVAGSMAAKAGFDWLVQGNADMETYQNTLAVVLKSQEKAADTLKWASMFAANTPFEIPEIVAATTKMASYGMEAQKVLGITGDMASVMGKSLDQATEAIADAQTGELERLKEFGITKAMIEAQGAKMGADFINKSGQITDQQAFNAAMFSLMEERYKGGMELQSKTFKGMLSNARDFIGGMGRQLGAPLFDKLKTGLGTTLAWIQRLKDSGQLDSWVSKIQQGAAVAWRVMSGAGRVIGAVFMESYRTARQNIEMIASKLRAWYAEHRPQIETLKQAFLDAFVALQTAWQQYAVPTIDWLYNEGLPAVIDALATLGGWIVDTGAWFIDNWGWVGPMLLGLAVAWGAIGVKILAVAVYQKAAAAVTRAWAAAQAVLNFAMNMNPIGLVITAVGLLIGAVILLVRHWGEVSTFLAGVWQRIKQTAVNVFTGIVAWFKKWGGLLLAAITGPVGLMVYAVIKNWDKIKGAAATAWNFVKDSAVAAWEGIVTGVSGMWGRIRDGFASGVNWIVGLVNTLIEKLNEALSITLPDWMGGYSFQLNLPRIPEMNMDGSHATGLARVPYDGYMAMLHAGERVLTAAQARQYDTAMGFKERQMAVVQPFNQMPIERPETASNTRRYDGALAVQQPAPQPAQPRQVNIDKLIEKVEIIAAPGDDGEALYAKFIEVFHRKAKEAAGILSTANMGELL